MAEERVNSNAVAVSTDDIAEYLRFAQSLVRQVGKELLSRFRTDLSVDDKSTGHGFDPVTDVDKKVERVMRDAITRQYPAHGIVGEEYGDQPGNGLTWVIDPIDGTRAFMTGMLHWGTLLGLSDGMRPIIGTMYQPFADELFWGISTEAGYRHGNNQTTIRTRRCQALPDAVMGTTGPEFYRRAEELEGLTRLRNEVLFTRFGGDCYVFAMVAMGQLDIGIEASLKPYDIQPMIPIIEGAGGVVTTWEGGDANQGGRVIAAGDPAIHAEAMKLLQRALV